MPIISPKPTFHEFLTELKTACTEQPPYDQVIWVNVTAERLIIYEQETGTLDYWQAPDETYQLGRGDCEDFAVFQLYCLLQIGWQPDSLALAYGRYDGQAHVVLQAQCDGGWLVLDRRGPCSTEYYPMSILALSRGADPYFNHGLTDDGVLAWEDRLNSIRPFLTT
jgi:hypothetical protein